MIKWCAYCQQYQGESEPFDQLGLTHVLCPVCAARGLNIGDRDFELLTQLRELQSDLYSCGRDGALDRIDLLVERSRLMGIRPIDMVVGLLSPMLVQIGILWATKQISVRDEHRFSEFASRFLMAIAKNIPPLSNEPSAQVLLACADGNYHTFGLRVVQLWLATEGISCELITPSVPSNELFEYARALRPKVLGLSISMPEQSAALDEIRAGALSKETVLWLGGYAVKSGQLDLERAGNAALVKDILQLPSLLGPIGR